MDKQEEIMKILQDSEALISGHFQLSGGLHSSQYLQCALAFQYPKHAARLASALADKFRTNRVTCIIGPAIGSIILAHEMGKTLGAKAVFAERESGRMTLRRGFALTPSDRVLVVEDVVTTGNSTRAVVELVKSLGARVVGIGAIADRSESETKFRSKYKYLIKLNLPTYTPEKCPLCKKEIPLVKPGSR